MPKLYKYKKIIDEYTTHTVQGEGVLELCEIDGKTIICVPDNSRLEVPEKVKTLEELILTDAVKQVIKKNSDHIQLINRRVVEKIREKYDMNDEMKLIKKMLRFLVTKTAPDVGSLSEFNLYITHVDTCITWGNEEKAKLGT